MAPRRRRAVAKEPEIAPPRLGVLVPVVVKPEGYGRGRRQPEQAEGGVVHAPVEGIGGTRREWDAQDRRGEVGHRHPPHRPAATLVGDTVGDGGDDEGGNDSGGGARHDPRSEEDRQAR